MEYHSTIHNEVIQHIKNKCVNLPQLRLPGPNLKIFKTDAGETSLGGILKQKLTDGLIEIIKYVFGSFK